MSNGQKTITFYYINPNQMPEKRKRLILIDENNYIYNGFLVEDEDGEFFVYDLPEDLYPGGEITNDIVYWAYANES